MENTEGKLEKTVFPEVNFELPTIDEQTDTIFHFCYEESSGGLDWSEIVYRRHPKLGELVEGISDRNEFKERCHEYIETYLAENNAALEETKERFQNVWDEVSNKFFASLTEDFETDLPEEITKIKARVSINSICPRYLDQWSFDVFYKSSDDRMKQTCAHESDPEITDRERSAYNVPILEETRKRLEELNKVYEFI